ncbi:MAG: FG-GAP-like repeat-containing protein [Acidobacteria bacterium]|nr:FG-GAP-like repeat-containing protein [Acidobacteriota bacterium]
MTGIVRRCGAWVLAAGAAGCAADGPDPLALREAAYRANNRGIARLEQFDYAPAAAAFREALAVGAPGAGGAADGAPADDALPIARLNLALALFYDQDLEGAGREAAVAAESLPGALEPPYLLGLIARAENRPEDARGWFDQVLEQDAADVGTNINLGQIELETRDYAAAIPRLRVAADAEPFNVTAVYNLGLALARSGETDEGRALLQQAQTLRSSGYAVTYGSGYLEEGRYARAIASTGAEPELVDAAPPAAAFAAAPIDLVAPPADAAPAPFGRRFAASELDADGARALAASLGGGVAAFDADGDGDLDLLRVAPEGEQLLRNDGSGQWTDVTEASGLGTSLPGAVGIGAIAADFDNNLATDLFVLRYGGSSLYRNDGAGRFIDVTGDAGLPADPTLPGAAAFTDIDHDGDVDILLAGLADLAATRAAADAPVLFPDEFAPAPLRLLRNNQDGTFQDVTAEAGLQADGRVVAVVPTDFDNSRDVDLLIVDHAAGPRLFTNLRDGTFREVAEEVGLAEVGSAAGAIRAAAAGDVNKDDYPDLFFAGASGLVVAQSDGRGRFTVEPGPDAAGAAAAGLVDYDNDGLPDLFAWLADGPRLFRNLGSAWSDLTEPAGLSAAASAVGAVRSAHAAAVADFTGDGASDVAAGHAGGLALLVNGGEPGNDSLRVRITGLASNRTGVGAKVQMRAGSLRTRLETSAATPAVAPADLVFGLGTREGADVVRVLWPSGILQAETAADAAAEPAADAAEPAGAPGPPPVLPSPLAVRELDRKPSSCPILFTWNGERFIFVTDFLGGGEMGYWQGPGIYNTPDPVEYIRIRGDQLRPRDGLLELRVTNELEEVLFVDQFELLALAHPGDVEVHPNEGMPATPKPYRLHAVRNVRPPVRAVDDAGGDVTDRIAGLDGRYADRLPLAQFRGYARKHTLTLDLGATSGPTTLLLTGWTDYAFSSDNVAAYQAGIAPMMPLLEVRAAGGGWRPAPVDVGIPVGRPQTIAVDLAGVLRPGEREVRLTTTFRIYWDRIQVADGLSPEAVGVRTTRLAAGSAELRHRGFSAEVHAGHPAPLTYDYARVSRVSPWKTMAGRYTREGDVRELVADAEDMFVVARDGDELALTFDATGLEPLPEGWTRTYFLRADGFSKEMDINSAIPDTVAPLPFHRMTGYPYGKEEHYPDTPEHRKYRETYNTRVIVRSVPLLEASR